MNNEQKNVKDALSDIFDTDFLEINIDSKQKNEEDKSIENDNEKYTINPFVEKENFFYKEEDEVIENQDINNYIAITEETENDLSISENINLQEDTEKTNNDDLNNDKNETKSNNSNYKKILIYFLIGFIMGVIIIYFVIKNVSNVQKNSYCFKETKNSGYTLIDEYTITYKANKIIYISGVYEYTAKSDDFKAQIEHIRNEKLPVIVNSNGMPGFTHLYEQGESNIKIESYYDVSLMDFEMIDKNDNKINPISYLNLKSDVSYKKLKNSLEKNGYKCTLSK